MWKTSESLLSVKIVSDTRLGAEKIEVQHCLMSQSNEIGFDVALR